MTVQTGNRAKLPISHSQASEQFKIATEDGQHKSVRENPLLSLPISRLPNATVHFYQEDLKVDWRIVQKHRDEDETVVPVRNGSSSSS